MKTTIEINGYEIIISLSEDNELSVQATKEGEVVEEFTLDGEEKEGQENDDDTVEMDGDADELDMEDAGQDDDMEDDSEEDEDESKLESFSSFVKRRN